MSSPTPLICPAAPPNTPEEISPTSTSSSVPWDFHAPYTLHNNSSSPPASPTLHPITTTLLTVRLPHDVPKASFYDLVAEFLPRRLAHYEIEYGLTPQEMRSLLIEEVRKREAVEFDVDGINRAAGYSMADTDTLVDDDKVLGLRVTVEEWSGLCPNCALGDVRPLEFLGFIVVVEVCRLLRAAWDGVSRAGEGAVEAMRNGEGVVPAVVLFVWFLRDPVIFLLGGAYVLVLYFVG